MTVSALPGGEPPPEVELRDSQSRQDPISRFSLIGGNDLYTPTPIDWLVHDTIESDSTACLYGASGTGKTFIALDMSLSIATGLDWLSKPVTAGQVVYIAGEGKGGLKRRISAWAQTHNAFEPVGHNFFLLSHTAVLPTDCDELMQTLEQCDNLKLLVLDTLQRTNEGDENSTKDASEYIRAVDKIRESYPGLAILIIHHTGHEGSRARGSSVLRASLETEIRVSQAGDVLKIECTKSKESEPFSPIAVELQTERLVDERWQGATSAIVKHLPGYEFTSKASSTKTGANQKKALQVLGAFHAEAEKNLQDYDRGSRISIEDWRKRCTEERPKVRDFKQSQAFYSRIVQPLQGKALVIVEGVTVCPA